MRVVSKLEQKNIKWLVKHYMERYEFDSLDTYTAHSNYFWRTCTYGERGIVEAYVLSVTLNNVSEFNSFPAYQVVGEYFEGIADVGHCIFWHKDWFDITIKNPIKVVS